jgi:hypothetical protein
MSSWGGGRVHFRERKLPNLQNISQADIVQTKPIEANISSAPSRWVIPKYTAVICAIALNEEKYIDEWIKYHIALGFQHIYIYDNSDNNSLKNKSSNFVTVIHFPGPTKQLEAYDLFVTTYKNKHKWAAFMDCDEFIILKKHNNIVDFLNDYDNFSGVGLNWLFFGTANQTEFQNEPVTKRFQYCSNKLDLQIKCIIKINKIYKYTTPHSPLLVEGIICNINKNKIESDFNDDLNSDVAYIHHYYTKSEQEFREKIERGRADIPKKRSLDELINIHNQNNDILNSDAWDFYSKHVLS